MALIVESIPECYNLMLENFKIILDLQYKLQPKSGETS